MARKFDYETAVRSFMPAPNSREAPAFKSSCSDELLRFLNQSENLCRQCGIFSGRQMVVNLTQYAYTQSESEWIAFDSFDNGTWVEFKPELISAYPFVLDHE